jgi:hypothetical protein
VFADATAYTATITLTAQDTYLFSDSCTSSIVSKTLSSALSGDKKTLTITAAYVRHGRRIWDSFDNLNVQPLVSVAGKPTLVPRPLPTRRHAPICDGR